MPGPTTEVLNEDIKELKAEIRDIRDDLASMKADTHAIAVGLAEFRGEVRTSLAVAKWAGGLFMGTLLTLGVTSMIGGVWWASRVETKLENIKERFEKLEANTKPKSDLRP